MKDNLDLSNESKHRPYWHVDAKWIFGILFVFSLSLLLFFGLLSQLTNKQNGTKIMSLALAVAYSGGDINKTSDFEEAKKKADANGNFCPIPNSSICINLKEYEKLGAKEARVKFWGQFAEMIYKEDFEKYAKNPAQLEKIKKDTTMLRVASARTNNLFKNIFFVILVPTLVSLVLLIRFSFRWGRLTSPALAAIWVALPGALLMAFFSIIKTPPPNPNNPGPLGRYSPIATEVLPIISNVGLRIYLSVFLTGLLLLLSALIGKILIRRKSRLNQNG